jgi:hypothetical protein
MAFMPKGRLSLVRVWESFIYNYDMEHVSRWPCQAGGLFILWINSLEGDFIVCGIGVV